MAGKFGPSKAFRTRARRKAKTPVAVTKKQVVKIAKAAVMKSAETKSYLASYSIIPADNTWNVQNLIYPISQGDTAEQIEGEKLFIKNIRFNGFVAINNPASTSTTRQYRMVVFATKKPLTNSSSGITVTDLVRAGGSANSMCQHIDLHKVDLLYDRKFSLTQALSGQTVTRPFMLNVPINKTCYFEADNAGYLKDKNYYMALVASDGFGGSAGTAPVKFEYTWTVNFKDI